MYKISFVVDRNPIRYYQAELLLFSLERFASHPREDILVQCVDGVDDIFLDFLRTSNYSYRIIEPFLDGKYCNKVRQLEAFEDDESCQGIFLLDTDVFVLEPMVPYKPETFCAKIVDGGNPPREVLERIFQAANIPAGNLTFTDWETDDQTYDSNFNGGYYYIPQKNIHPLSVNWKKWATWLFERPHLFNHPQQVMHTDQVSMALALRSTGIPYTGMPSNYNTPLHYSHPLRYFEPTGPVRMMHYHHMINRFGWLDAARSANEAIRKSVEKANAAIIRHADFHFFRLFKSTKSAETAQTGKTARLISQLQELLPSRSRKLRLILHAGTPKTGSTSLQFFFDQNQEALKASGILYPPIYLRTYAPKHQWLVHAFMQANVEMLTDYFRQILSDLDENIHTIILSTEGIYNHWHDYSPEARSFLTVWKEVFNLEIWTWFRSPQSFIKSLYRQNLKNPQIVKPCYGKDMSMADMLQDPWFEGHLDYLGFLIDLENIIGRQSNRVFKHGQDIVAAVIQELDLKGNFLFPERENIGLSDSSIEMLRIINRYPLSALEKEKCVQLLTEIDHITGQYPQQKQVDQHAELMIRERFALQAMHLKKNYNLSFE